MGLCILPGTKLGRLQGQPLAIAMHKLQWCIVSHFPNTLLNAFLLRFQLGEDRIEDVHGDCRVISSCLMVGP